MKLSKTFKSRAQKSSHCVIKNPEVVQLFTDTLISWNSFVASETAPLDVPSKNITTRKYD